MPDWPEIIEREGGAVWRMAYRLLGNRADADECFQDVFVAALEVSRREPVRDWGALLRRLAATRSMDRLRRRYRRGEGGPAVDWETLIGPSPSPSQGIEDAERAESLRAALAALPPNQAEAFCLHHLEGWSYREIAGHLAISVERRRGAAAPGTEAVARAAGIVRRGPARGGARAGSPPGAGESARGAAMSPNPPIPTPDDPIARATDALRRTPVPDGPPPETIARTLAALRTAAEEPGPIPRPRRRLMFTMLKTAATVLAAAAGVWYFAGSPPRSATAEFIEAARKLQAARTLSLLHTQTIAGLPETMKGRILYKIPGLMRTEPEPAGAAVSIFDSIHNKILILNPADKSAMLLEEQAGSPAPKRDGAAMMIEDIRRLAGKDNEPVGEKVIGDVRARGFRVKEQGQDMTIWVDPQKKLPVLIEFSGRAGNLDYHGTFSDIRLDVELDDALFRLEPPAGYTLRKANARINMTFEEAVARWLRNYTKASGGRFPAKLDDFDGYLKVVSAATKKATAKEAKTKEAKLILDPAIFEDSLAGAFLAAFCQKYKDHYGYKPDGVKFGDAKTMVFWYQPEGQAKYKAVYGDLHVGEVTAEELPRK